MNSVKYLNILDDPDENQSMVCKLPWHLVDHWSCEVDRHLNKDEDQCDGDDSQLKATEDESAASF